MIASIHQLEPFQPPFLQRAAIGSVAVFRALRLGDMLCAVPALRALRGALPQARITLIGLPWAARFAERFPRLLDDFVAFPGHSAFPEQPVREAEIPGFYRAMRERRFDLAIQMHGDGAVSNRVVRAFEAKTVAGFVPHAGEGGEDHWLPFPETGPEPLRLLKLTEFLGAAMAGTHLEFPITAADERELRQSGLAAGVEPGRYVCIHPGASSRDKCWPAARFAAVADALAERFGVRIVLTGAEGERELTADVARHMRTPAVDAAGPISIGAMAALMRGARLLVCNDTGVSHIAAGLRLPSVVVFSRADIRRWAPLDGDLHRCIEDPQGARVEEAIAQAADLLAGHRRAADPLTLRTGS